MLGDFPLPSIPGRQRGAERRKEKKGTERGGIVGLLGWGRNDRFLKS